MKLQVIPWNVNHIHQSTLLRTFDRKFTNDEFRSYQDRIVVEYMHKEDFQEVHELFALFESSCGQAVEQHYLPTIDVYHVSGEIRTDRLLPCKKHVHKYVRPLKAY